jgi:hypothetical protein
MQILMQTVSDAAKKMQRLLETTFGCIADKR